MAPASELPRAAQVENNGQAGQPMKIRASGHQHLLDERRAKLPLLVLAKRIPQDVGGDGGNTDTPIADGGGDNTDTPVADDGGSGSGGGDNTDTPVADDGGSGGGGDNTDAPVTDGGGGGNPGPRPEPKPNNPRPTANPNPEEELAQRLAKVKSSEEKKAREKAEAELYGDLEEYKKIREKCGNSDTAVAQFLGMRDKFVQTRAAAESKGEAAVAAEKAKIRDPLAKKDSQMAPEDGELGDYKRLRAELGGSDENVTKYLAAREKMVKAKAESLVSPELARAEAMMKDQSLDLDFTDQSGKLLKARAVPAGFGPQYIKEEPWNISAPPTDNPESLDVAKWDKIMRINKSLFGFVIREKENDIAKARAPAFRMRKPDHVDLTPPPASDSKSGDTAAPKPGDAAAPQPPKKELIMPEFEVYDSSSISIKETTTSLQKSLAENGFSAHSVQAAFSGGSFGVSAGISAGLRESSSTGLAQTDASAQKEYFATYNFPRARVFMDELNLEVTPQCAADLRELLGIWREKLTGMKTLTPSIPAPPTTIGDSGTTPGTATSNTAAGSGTTPAPSDTTGGGGTNNADAPVNVPAEVPVVDIGTGKVNWEELAKRMVLAANTTATSAAPDAAAASGTAPDAATKAKEEELAKQEAAWNAVADVMLQKFSSKYGHVFATQFSLGGQLKSSRFASSLYSSTDTAKFDALKTAAAMSFSSMYASGSASASYETQKDVKTGEEKTETLSQLAWTARGGNTLLCANPPSWAATVGGHENWRILEQESVLTLHDLLGRFPEWREVPAAFEDIGKRRLKFKQKADESLKGTWRNKIKLTFKDPEGAKWRLAYDSDDADTIVTVKVGDEAKKGLREPIFRVANGVFEKKDMDLDLKGLYADWPLFLVCGEDLVRAGKDRGNQVPDLWVTADGKIKPEGQSQGAGLPTQIMRWSLRVKPPISYNPLFGQFGFQSTRDPWVPAPQTVIPNGANVWLYCHSLGWGFYRSSARPPSLASCVHWNQGLQRIGAFGGVVPDAQGIWPVSRDYDEGRIDVSPEQQNNPEVKGDWKYSSVAQMEVVENWGWRYVMFQVEYV